MNENTSRMSQTRYRVTIAVARNDEPAKLNGKLSALTLHFSTLPPWTAVGSAHTTSKAQTVNAALRRCAKSDRLSHIGVIVLQEITRTDHTRHGLHLSLTGMEKLADLIVVNFAYFHSIISYGIIFWGNCIDSKKVFHVQKRVVRINNLWQNKDSYRPLFKSSEILTIACEYMFSVPTYIRVQKQPFISEKLSKKGRPTLVANFSVNYNTTFKKFASVTKNSKQLIEFFIDCTFYSSRNLQSSSTHIFARAHSPGGLHQRLPAAGLRQYMYVLGRHLESSPTRVMHRGGLRRQPVSPEHSCAVAKHIGNSGRREEVCDASKSRCCRHLQLEGGGADRYEASFPDEGRARQLSRRQLQQIFRTEALHLSTYSDHVRAKVLGSGIGLATDYTDEMVGSPLKVHTAGREYHTTATSTTKSFRDQFSEIRPQLHVKQRRFLEISPALAASGIVAQGPRAAPLPPPQGSYNIVLLKILPPLGYLGGGGGFHYETKSEPWGKRRGKRNSRGCEGGKPSGREGRNLVAARFIVARAVTLSGWTDGARPPPLRNTMRGEEEEKGKETGTRNVVSRTRGVASKQLNTRDPEACGNSTVYFHAATLLCVIRDVICCQMAIGYSRLKAGRAIATGYCSVKENSAQARCAVAAIHVTTFPSDSTLKNNTSLPSTSNGKLIGNWARLLYGIFECSRLTWHSRRGYEKTSQHCGLLRQLKTGCDLAVPRTEQIRVPVVDRDARFHSPMRNRLLAMLRALYGKYHIARIETGSCSAMTRFSRFACLPLPKCREKKTIDTKIKTPWLHVCYVTATLAQGRTPVNTRRPTSGQREQGLTKFVSCKPTGLLGRQPG
ncbi:hypothetical protein PR048_021338 [Dryococelus australis]|uniref:Uncharacterized protein n=1 Tax=Dryococelus australis TaxID=614101 RepID=A0ABQ9GXX2_9NEOP|nr:hypothetical protein PR048_021338 [Dryococelus australis]